MTPNIETLFEEHKYLINSTIRRNRPLLAALRLENEDVAQELSITMLSAIERFNPGCLGEQRSGFCSATSPERSDSLSAHIACSLQYEILNMKRRHKPHGITGVPNGEKIDFLYMDDGLPSGSMYELPSYDDTSAFEVSELLDSLSESETKVIDLKMNGLYLRGKAQTATLNGVRRKYNVMYKNEGRVAA